MHCRVRFLLAATIITLAGQRLYADPAPEAEILKVLALVQQDKHAEALKRVEALAVLHPDDERVAKIKTQLDRVAVAMVIAPAAPAGAAAATSWAGLPVLDRVQAAAIESIAREADRLLVGAERRAKFTDMMERTRALTGKYPGVMRLWLFHGLAALELDDFAAGHAAGERLLAAPGEPDEATLQMLAQLERKGWLGQKGRELKLAQERAASERKIAQERKAQEERMERERRAAEAKAAREKAESLAKAEQKAARERAEAFTKAKEHWPQDGRDCHVVDLGLKLVFISPGTFLMGSRNGEIGEKHVTRVTLSRGFWLGKTEVTQAQWKAVMGNNPSRFNGDERPVENVSWDDALAFCRKLTERERASGRLPKEYAYTLPTEAQWEYACRAGTTSDYAGTRDGIGWYTNNSGKTSHPVGLKQANAWGLHDMHGNVYEWCLDWWNVYLKGVYPDGSVTDPTGPTSGQYHVYRSGSWQQLASYSRSFSRHWHAGRDNNSDGILGFRLALVPAR